jgi:hypothetical protein
MLVDRGYGIRGGNREKKITFSQFLDSYVGYFPEQSEEWFSALWDMFMEFEDELQRFEVLHTAKQTMNAWIKEFEDFVEETYPRLTGRVG